MVKAGIEHTHKLGTGKVQGQAWDEFEKTAARACHKVLSCLSLTDLFTMFAGDIKQGKIVILDGRTWIQVLIGLEQWSHLTG